MHDFARRLAPLRLVFADWRPIKHLDMRVDAPALRPVSVIDVWKALALGLILIDHLGHYLFPEIPLLRVIGRLGLPIFFFLVGYARTRGVPLRWLVIGVVLTGVDYLWTGQKGMPLINILFSFAALRLALPFLERFCLAPVWRIFVAMAGLAALMPLINPLIEYGTEGWLIALFGLILRRHHEAPAGIFRMQVALVAAFAAAVFIGVETIDYAFSPFLAGVLAGGTVLVFLGLMRFVPGAFFRQPSLFFARILHFCGRYNLEIYTAQIIGFAALGGALSSLNLLEINTDD